MAREPEIDEGEEEEAHPVRDGCHLLRDMSWLRTLGASATVASAALGSTGCAFAFRDSKPPVHIVSDPPGAEVQMKEKSAVTPMDVNVSRQGVTEIRVTMPGFEDHHGTVRKRMNALWLTADVATCIVPVLLCVPLLTDAVSGAWYDVDATYRAPLAPLALAATPADRPSPKPAATTPSPPHTAGAAESSMSQSERKASARAAYQEGIDLQSKSSYPDALARFQLAQGFFDAPTHVLHIAQCLALTGKLVEAQESYETLTHRELPAAAPEPFRDAIEVAKRELAELRPRIPTLRIEVTPSPATLRTLVLLLNGTTSNDVIGIARPMNPGTYRITATAWGIPHAKPVDVVLEEGDTKTIEIKVRR